MRPQPLTAILQGDMINFGSEFAGGGGETQLLAGWGLAGLARAIGRAPVGAQEPSTDGIAGPVSQMCFYQYMIAIATLCVVRGGLCRL